MAISRHLVLVAAGTLIGLPACDTGPRAESATATESAATLERRGDQPASKKMRVTVGSKTFAATLEDNPAAAKLIALLPLTLDMSELNGNEKFFHLPARLPTDAASPGTIQNGDLMLWGADSLVLFYKTFRTTYSYTRLGRVDDPSGLAAAVGSGRVAVTFELE